MNEGFCCKQTGHKNPEYISPSQGSGGKFAFVLSDNQPMSSLACLLLSANYFTPEATTR